MENPTVKDESTPPSPGDGPVGKANRSKDIIIGDVFAGAVIGAICNVGYNYLCCGSYNFGAALFGAPLVALARYGSPIFVLIIISGALLGGVTGYIYGQVDHTSVRKHRFTLTVAGVVFIASPLTQFLNFAILDVIGKHQGGR